MNFDVIILGSGPAGASCAITAIQQGLKVGLITKPLHSRKTGLRPTQSLHPGLESPLEQLGLKGIIDYSTVGTFRGITVNGDYNPLGPDESWVGHHIDRDLFDEYLMLSLKEAGVIVCEEGFRNFESNGLNVRVKSSYNSQWQASYLVDATGYKRKTKAGLKLEEKYYSSLMYCWSGIMNSSGDSNEPKFQSHGRGWDWTTPLDDGRTTWNKLLIDKPKEPLGQMFESKTLRKIESHLVRWRALRPIVKDRVILCGDAAGSLDPSAGQGILNAILSGRMAGNCIAACLTQPNKVDYFQTLYDSWFMKQYEEKIDALKSYYQQQNIWREPGI